MQELLITVSDVLVFVMIIFKDIRAGNRKELQATVLLESYSLITIAEMWWYELHDWRAAISGYKLFRRDRQGRGSRYYKANIYSEDGEALEQVIQSTCGCLVPGSI